ncbi:hypothetical protein D3C84_1068730 [compost metagenome]
MQVVHGSGEAMESGFELVVRIVAHGKPAVERRSGFVANVNNRIDGAAKARLGPSGVNRK